MGSDGFCIFSGVDSDYGAAVTFAVMVMIGVFLAAFALIRFCWIAIPMPPPTDVLPPWERPQRDDEACEHTDASSGEQDDPLLAWDSSAPNLPGSLAVPLSRPRAWIQRCDDPACQLLSQALVEASIDTIVDDTTSVGVSLNAADVCIYFMDHGFFHRGESLNHLREALNLQKPVSVTPNEPAQLVSCNAFALKHRW